MVSRFNKAENPALANDAVGWAAIGGGSRTAVTGFGRPFAFRKTGGTGSLSIYCARASAGVGETWTASIYIRSNVARTVNPTLDYYTSGSTFISDQVGDPVSLTANTVTRIYVTGTTVATTARLQLTISYTAAATSDVMDVTALMYEKVATLDGYFDGDTPNAVWDGTAGNSTSTLTPGTAIRYNKCPNPSLENDIAGWTDDGAGSRVAVTGFNRPYAYRLTSGTFVTSARAAASVAQTWTGSCYVRVTSNDTVIIYLDYFNASGTYLNDSPGYSVSLTAGIVSRVDVTHSPTDPNTASVGITTAAVTNGNVLDMTMVLLEQVNALDSYFDGDTPDASWDGVRGNSTSTFVPGQSARTAGFMPFFE